MVFPGVKVLNLSRLNGRLSAAEGIISGSTQSQLPNLTLGGKTTKEIGAFSWQELS